MTSSTDRRSFFRCVILCTGCATLLLPDCVHAQPPISEEFKEPAGLVWFAGTVERVDDGVPTIDLGEVHTLRKGSMVAVIRYRNGHFTPQGVIEVRFTNPTWCQTEQPKTFVAEVGDLIMFVEAPGDLGSGEAIRDSFIRYRVVANANRNRYSTMRDSIEANELQRMSDKQPGWIKSNRRIAGIVRTSSVTSDMLSRLKPFMNQILAFQSYEDQGVNVVQATSLSWKEILDELRRKPASMETGFAETETPVDENPAGIVATENNAAPDSSLAVRRQVDTLLFERSDEERSAVAVICATLLQTKTSDERQWMTQQLSKTQFPGLGNEDQMLIDMETIMRRVRKSE